MNNQNVTEPLDFTNLNQNEKTVSMLPAAIQAANLFNKKNQIGAIEVELPIAKFTVVCNPLSSIDEITAKTITGSIQMYMSKNLQVFFDATVFPADSWVKTIEDFKQLTEADFKTIIYGVMKASFKNLSNSSFICQNSSCVNPDETRLFKFVPQMKDININYTEEFTSPNNDYRKDSFISDLGNVVINYKFDTVGERLKIFSGKSNDEIRKNVQTIKALVSKLELLPIFIDSIVIGDSSLDEPIKLSDKNEITIFMHKLNSTSKEIIEESNNKYIDHILGYQPKFSARVICPHCEHVNTWEDIDLMVEFFLKISTVY